MTINNCHTHIFSSRHVPERYLNAETRAEMDATWFEKVKVLLRDFENTYADIAYTRIDMSLVPLINVTLQSPHYRKRILYGTDFYMNGIEGNELMFSVYLRNALGEQNFRQIATVNPVNYLF